MYLKPTPASTPAAGDSSYRRIDSSREEFRRKCLALAGGDVSVSGEATPATEEATAGREEPAGDGAASSDDQGGGDADAGGTEEEAAPLPLNVVFDILKNERRRLVLRYLREHGGPATIGELAEHIAAHENDKPVAALSSDERKRAYVGLYQCHFPKMEDAGVIDSDRNLGVTLGENAKRVFEYFDIGDEDAEPNGADDRWYRVHAGLALVAIPVYAAMLAGPADLRLLFEAGVGIVLLLCVVAAAVHAADEGAIPFGRE